MVRKAGADPETKAWFGSSIASVDVKTESAVIADEHAAVNIETVVALPAHHGPRGGCLRSPTVTDSLQWEQQWSESAGRVEGPRLG